MSTVSRSAFALASSSLPVVQDVFATFNFMHEQELSRGCSRAAHAAAAVMHSGGQIAPTTASSHTRVAAVESGES